MRKRGNFFVLSLVVRFNPSIKADDLKEAGESEKARAGKEGEIMAGLRDK